MAETFGVIAGALSVAALFNNCVDCFEYIQLGRSFGRDFERCRLKLCVITTRLSRWGEATSARYKLKVTTQELALYEDKDMQPAGQRVHRRLQDITKSDESRKKATWALYDGKSLEKVISQMTEFISELEAVYPIDASCQRLAEMEIEEVEEEASLRALEDAAREVDGVLAAATQHKISAIVGTNSAKDVKTEGSARVHIGTGRGGKIISGRIDNSAEMILSTGTSAVQVGNTLASSTESKKGESNTVAGLERCREMLQPFEFIAGQARKAMVGETYSPVHLLRLIEFALLTLVGVESA
ncbi:unnamed protein product [Parascedosporium putredinis]|uniref:Prion-inhibition and propagation HeLo domain-containing protein n=1 Tax=Parascedosporium putredinis TaxID=1442378 RepID=A0A9P1H362_9PEZI|nr:unnamed protein product [Parascedosporium putredinis]CAI7994356.1 unnamed protein product [Parascedosporium putredinis]